MKDFKKKLDIREPIIHCYTNYGHALSMLQCKEQTYDWIYSNFIEVFLNKDLTVNTWGDFYTPMTYEIRSIENCQWLRIQKVRRKDVISSRERALEYLINELSQGYYVHTFIEHKAIISFETNNHYHDALIYGIDCQEGVAYAQDVFYRGKYERKVLTLDELLNSMVQCEVKEESDYLYGMAFSYCLKESCDYVLDLGNIKQCLDMYYHSRTPEYWKCYNSKDAENIFFGLDIYKSFLNYIEQIQEQQLESVDLRPFYFLKDHKIIMVKRLEYIHEKGYIQKDMNTAIAIYKELLEKFELLTVFILGFTIDRNYNKLRKAKTIIQEMYEMEQGVVPIMEELLGC